MTSSPETLNPLRRFFYVEQETAPWPPSPGLEIVMADLTEGGDTFDLGDGFSLSLEIGPDSEASVNDYESDGRVQWAHESPPSDFDPDRSFALIYAYCETLWWEMPGPDVMGDIVWTPEEIETNRARVARLCEEGFLYAMLKLSETVTDSFGGDHTVEIARTSLYGVDEMHPEIVGDLVCALRDELEVLGQ